MTSLWVLTISKATLGVFERECKDLFHGRVRTYGWALESGGHPPPSLDDSALLPLRFTRADVEGPIIRRAGKGTCKPAVVEASPGTRLPTPLTSKSTKPGTR